MLKSIIAVGMLTLGTLGLSACSALHQEGGAATSTEPARAYIIPVPKQPSGEAEFAIQRLSDIMNLVDINDEQHAKLLYNRGRYYDAVGLNGLAMQDFQHALKLDPKQPDIYNYIGILQTENQDYLDAYESFDSVLELDPDHEYAHLNRAIALYYGHRAKQALADAKAFYKAEPDDPYRALWLYLIERRTDPAAAAADLANTRAQLDDQQWAVSLVDLYLGKASEQEVMENLAKHVDSQKQLTESICEAYFYFGKRRQWLNEPKAASMYYRLALATNIYGFVEHRYATLEMQLLGERHDEPSHQPSAVTENANKS